MRLIHPEGSGYRSETGGLMSALRTLDIQQSMSLFTSYSMLLIHNVSQFGTFIMYHSSGLPHELLRSSQPLLDRCRKGHRRRRFIAVSNTAADRTDPRREWL